MEIAINGKNRKIAFDIDGILINFHNPLVIFYNKKHGTSFKVEDITTYDFSRAFQTTEEQFRRDMNEFYSSPLFRSLPLIKGARRAVRQLSQNNFLGVITSRPDFIYEETLISLRKHFPETFSGVYFTNHYGGNGPRKNKSDFCLEHGYEVIVEDVLEYASECADKGINALLLDKPWNQNGSLHPRVQRVFSWAEILEHLKQKLK